jgi:anti-anti-sigma factor
VLRYYCDRLTVVPDPAPRLIEEAKAVIAEQTRPGQVAVHGTLQDGVLIVTIEGDLDVATAPALCRYLDQAGRDRLRGLVFDLAGVGFMDCAAASAILTTADALPGRPRPVLRCPCPAVRRLLSLSGLDSRCSVTASSRFAAR